MIDSRRLVRGLALLSLFEIDSTVHRKDEVLRYSSTIDLARDDLRLIAYFAMRERYNNRKLPPIEQFELDLSKPIETRSLIDQLLIDALTSNLHHDVEVTEGLSATIEHEVLVPDLEDLELNISQAADILPVSYQKQANELAEGILHYKTALDAIIFDYASNVPIQDMVTIDRNLLRMVLYEYAIKREVPFAVAVSEAVELAKVFGSDSSPRFINGVIGALRDNDTEVKRKLKGLVSKINEKN